MEIKLDRAICLCLDKRQEHWEDLRQQCESRGIEFIRFLVGKGEIFPREEYDYIDDPSPNLTYWRYGSPETKKNHYNAFMSHKGMLRYAIDNNFESVLFLEDDAYFTERFEDVFNKVKETLEPIDWQKSQTESNAPVVPIDNEAKFRTVVPKSTADKLLPNREELISRMDSIGSSMPEIDTASGSMFEPLPSTGIQAPSSFQASLSPTVVPNDADRELAMRMQGNGSGIAALV